MKVRDGAIVPHDDDIDFSGLYDKESLDDFWANDFDKFAAALRQLGLQAHRLSSVWIKIAVLYDGADVPWSARCVNQARFAPKSYNKGFSAFSCDTTCSQYERNAKVSGNMPQSSSGGTP